MPHLGAHTKQSPIALPPTSACVIIGSLPARTRPSEQRDGRLHIAPDKISIYPAPASGIDCLACLGSLSCMSNSATTAPLSTAMQSMER